MSEEKKTQCPKCGNKLEKKLLAYDGDKPVYVIACKTDGCYVSLPIRSQADADREYNELFKQGDKNEERAE